MSHGMSPGTRRLTIGIVLIHWQEKSVFLSCFWGFKYFPVVGWKPCWSLGCATTFTKQPSPGSQSGLSEYLVATSQSSFSDTVQ